jgi:hypothetical protein
MEKPERSSSPLGERAAYPGAFVAGLALAAVSWPIGGKRRHCILPILLIANVRCPAFLANVIKEFGSGVWNVLASASPTLDATTAQPCNDFASQHVNPYPDSTKVVARLRSAVDLGVPPPFLSSYAAHFTTRQAGKRRSVKCHRLSPLADDRDRSPTRRTPSAVAPRGVNGYGGMNTPVVHPSLPERPLSHGSSNSRPRRWV